MVPQTSCDVGEAPPPSRQKGESEAVDLVDDDEIDAVDSEFEQAAPPESCAAEIPPERDMSLVVGAENVTTDRGGLRDV
eukprot:2243233-Alexandrium_andersonii.AAC.1